VYGQHPQAKWEQHQHHRQTAQQGQQQHQQQQPMLSTSPPHQQQQEQQQQRGGVRGGVNGSKVRGVSWGSRPGSRAGRPLRPQLVQPLQASGFRYKPTRSPFKHKRVMMQQVRGWRALSCTPEPVCAPGACARSTLLSTLGAKPPGVQRC
jgi:hypothetical protein